MLGRGTDQLRYRHIRDKELGCDGEGRESSTQDQERQHDPRPASATSARAAVGREVADHGGVVVGLVIKRCGHTRGDRPGTPDDRDRLGELVDRGRSEAVRRRRLARRANDVPVDDDRQWCRRREHRRQRRQSLLEAKGIEPSGVVRERSLDEHRIEGAELVGLRKRLADPTHQRRDRGVSGERHPAGDRLVEDEAQRVDVGLAVDVETLCLLGRRIAYGPDHRADRLGPAGLGERSRHAEVGDPQTSLVVEEEVRRLHVSVDEASGVRIGQAGCGLTTDEHRLLDRQGHPSVQDVLERPAGEELGDEIRHAVLLAPVVDLQDVRVVERRDRARFGSEPLQECLVLRKGWLEELDRDRPLERGVHRPVDDRRRAGPKDGFDPVATPEDRPDLVRRYRHVHPPTY